MGSGAGVVLPGAGTSEVSTGAGGSRDWGQSRVSGASERGAGSIACAVGALPSSRVLALIAAHKATLTPVCQPRPRDRRAGGCVPPTGALAAGAFAVGAFAVGAPVFPAAHCGPWRGVKESGAVGWDICMTGKSTPTFVINCYEFAIVVTSLLISGLCFPHTSPPKQGSSWRFAAVQRAKGD